MSFDLNDLKTAIISIGVFFICVAIQRYWSKRNIKSLKRQIDETEAYKARLNNLARSDRALLIMGFQAVLGIVMIVCCIGVIEIALLMVQTQILLTLMHILLWSIPIVVCIALLKTLQDVRDHPQAQERLERKVTELKNKLLQG